MDLKEYLTQVKKRFESGISTEHSYRADLQAFITGLDDGVTVTNEPKRQACGAPDYIVMIKDVPVGYIEAKDIGVDLDEVEDGEQMGRYRASLHNLILTDYCEFRFYRDGKRVTDIRVAEIHGKKITPLPENFEGLELLIKDFCSYQGTTITSAESLAHLMAKKARMMEVVIHNAVKEEGDDNTLKDQLAAFRKILIHDLDEQTFADIYAQTIAYGLFAARLHDSTLDTFSRQEARELIPKSNPFLRNLFDYVSGANLDERVVWIVDDLAAIFRATDIKALLADFGKATAQNDPFLHFYETFLAEYDPKLRKSRGVYYTPEPVVNFIVRAVDDILRTEFGITDGLADTSKVKIKLNENGGIKIVKGQSKMVEKEVHKVQILDPATGTGTFLAEVIKHIHKRFEGQKGAWSGYVSEHLIPRLNGFEILMAPYTMCHLKLEMLLRETGYVAKEGKEPRLRVFLTNSLEEPHEDTGTLFAQWLSREASEANMVKRDTPVMVVLGNPPYSGESENIGEWITELLSIYKQEPSGGKLQERNYKWINDDYVKFIRYGEYFVEKNGSGIVAFITPHGYLDNPTFRGMRWHLLNTFNSITIIDLHGNTKRKEVSPDGTVDQNVFDIQQGVSIGFFVKYGNRVKKELAKVSRYDVFGTRESKYEFLLKNTIADLDYINIALTPPNYLLIDKDDSLSKKYEKGLVIPELFVLNGVGITTAHDEFVIDNERDTLKKRFTEFRKSKPDSSLLHQEFNVKPKKGWDITSGWKNLQLIKDIDDIIIPIDYRPFDSKFILYENKLVWRTVEKIMKHFIKRENIGFVTVNRQLQDKPTCYYFLTKNIMSTGFIRSDSVSVDSIFPLYTFDDNEKEQTFEPHGKRKPNLNTEIVAKIAEGLGMEFVAEKEEMPTDSGSKGLKPLALSSQSFAPIDILDYIYAVLHSPKYREKYKEFLKIDFPRVPYPKDKDIFWALVKLGGELRGLHLLESPVVEKLITTYPVDGDNTVGKIKYEKGKVWINDKQYFDKVPEAAWEFYIGGYQPAQKWLKDRKERVLSFEDIRHYQKVIVALTETERIMGEIDEVGVM